MSEIRIEAPIREQERETREEEDDQIGINAYTIIAARTLPYNSGSSYLSK